MKYEQTNASDTQGETTNTSTTETEELTPSAKLKAENDALQFEMERAQKIRNEALLAGTAGGRVEPVVKEETEEELAEKFDKGEVDILEK